MFGLIECQISRTKFAWINDNDKHTSPQGNLNTKYDSLEQASETGAKFVGWIIEQIR